jgi:hypothetical protein
MGVLAGYSLKEIKRSIQHGQPQMTIADLLGNPLPSTLVAARDMGQCPLRRATRHGTPAAPPR